MKRVGCEGAGHLAGTGVLLAIVAAVAIGGNSDIDAPPRFDGAGYAVLGEALRTGRGYREIDHPEQPRHAHYPPGYPAALALLWRMTGRSVAAAHWLSFACTVAATLIAWGWFRSLYPPRIAGLLGLALALNWTWGRIGGAIQSEPLFLLLEMLAVRIASRAGRGIDSGVSRGVVLGLVLGSCVLTRHTAACLVVALLLDLWLRDRHAAAASAGLVVVALILPWVAWLTVVGHDTQIRLLAEQGLASRVARHLLFYLQRIPDQLTGPVVEIGTVFGHSRTIAALANLWAVLASGLVIAGWLRSLRTPRRRVAGLVPLTTFPLLLAWPFTEAGRFLIPIVPFLLVGAVEGLAAVTARVGLRRSRDWAAGAVLILSIPYSVHALVNDRAGARRDIDRDFDAACVWIVQQGRSHPGPILSRHPGEVYWLTGRSGLAPRSDDPEATDHAIDRYRVAYLLIDEERYARAPASPLGRYVARHPERVRLVWQRKKDGTTITIYAVQRPAVSQAAGPG